MAKSFCYLLFLCLLVAAGRGLTAQNNPDELQEMANNHYRLTGLKMSENGRWLTAWKSYDLNGDTLLIFDSRVPGKPAAYRTKVTGIAFPGANHLLMKSAQRAELLNLKKQTSVFFEEVRKFQHLESKGQFLVHYNEKRNDKLELYDRDATLLNKTEQVTRFYCTGKGNTYAIKTNGNNESEIVRITADEMRKVYSTCNGISYLEVDPEEKGMMIYERGPDHAFQQISHLDLDDMTISPLKDVIPLGVQNGFSEAIQGKSTYFMKLLVETEKQDTSLVDIWYGNDHKLEKKFHPPTTELNYLWEPQKKRIQQIGDEQATTNVNLGNERHFLSFNRWSLNDYRWSLPSLVIGLYCPGNNLYSQIDTIRSRLFTSKNGDYLLYTKKGKWCLFCIATGTKKLIGGSDLNTPYFTSDSKSVLFEGNGGLWQYDLKNDQLTKLIDFPGYQTTLLNSTSEVTGNFNFYRKVIDPAKPMVVRLLDPETNQSAYVLVEKGTAKAIIPPTTKRIQFLNYNDACRHFCYTEEDYNLPPRLVYKEMGEKETVVYQSNRQDTAILSLKREILSYTNSDSVPLKGILYCPLGYDPSRNYPMVVHIYQVQSNKEANEYPVVAYSQANNDGFNLRLLLENGYFVYFPDIVYGEKGTGLSALDCVDHALDALNNSSIDQSKIGLIGHSHGGYETNFIATRSSRFAAYVSGAGNSDIVRSYFSFNYNFLSPFYWQYENGQYEMGKSFSEDKNLYFHNNPIHYADQVNAPILLWAGKKDQNIDWEQTMEFYVGLKRNNKKVVALFYPNEGHALFGTDACRDLVSRILDWFGYFLKGEETEFGWIEKGIVKEGAP